MDPFDSDSPLGSCVFQKCPLPFPGKSEFGQNQEIVPNPETTLFPSTLRDRVSLHIIRESEASPNVQKHPNSLKTNNPLAAFADFSDDSARTGICA